MLKNSNIIKVISLLVILPFFTTGVARAEELNVKEFILEHLADSYSWHITRWGDREMVVPLPVIVRSREGGWSLFLSSKLDHGAEYKGFSISQEGAYSGKVVERNGRGEVVRPMIDISLTKTSAALIINSIILLLVILPLARWYKTGTMKPTKGFLGAVEMLLVDIQDEVIKVCVGEDYRRFSPYLLTAFFFIFVNNLMGLIPFFPGGANVTGNIAVTFFLAICTFFTVNVFGNKAYWKEILWPDVPVWLKVPAPLMPLIEIFGIFTKPFALTIRLFANIVAGHSIILGLICIIFITSSMGAGMNTGMSVVSIIFTCFMFFVELLVAYIQAYVFTLLSSVFIGLARAKHEAHAH
ncbi:MAG: F0F1 ATP synthase subunit A [Prevotellaceae bacterium]|jgi:F-type H+-transporting ATPase subunit a|nr:F0F1 ATP synthase subunit A [Prevotellaceae bacterium]